jgi:hypothetical protein
MRERGARPRQLQARRAVEALRAPGIGSPFVVDLDGPSFPDRHVVCSGGQIEALPVRA